MDAQTWNHLVYSSFACQTKFALCNPKFAQIPSWSRTYNYNELKCLIDNYGFLGCN